MRSASLLNWGKNLLAPPESPRLTWVPAGRLDP